MDMYELLGRDSPEKIKLLVAENFKACRKMKHITQVELAKKSMVPYGTIRNFEQTGNISIASLILLAEALDMSSDFKLLFNKVNHQSREDILNESKKYR